LPPRAIVAKLGRMGFLVHWVVTAVALAVGARVVPGIVVASGGTLLIAALVLGLVNAVIRPVLTILTLPITVLTLGLFYLVVNGLAFALAAWLVPGFTVASLGSAIGGALVVSIVSSLLGWILTPRPRDVA
jgi:putative membrane protein